MTTFCAKLPTHVCTILIYCFALYSNFCGHRPRQDFFTSNLSAAEKLPLRNRNEAIIVKQNVKTAVTAANDLPTYVYFLRYLRMVYISIVCWPLKTAAVKEATCTSLNRRFSTVHVHTVGSLATVLTSFSCSFSFQGCPKIYGEYVSLRCLAQLQMECLSCCNAIYTDVIRLNSLIVWHLRVIIENNNCFQLFELRNYYASHFQLDGPDVYIPICCRLPVCFLPVWREYHATISSTQGASWF